MTTHSSKRGSSKTQRCTATAPTPMSTIRASITSKIPPPLFNQTVVCLRRRYFFARYALWGPSIAYILSLAFVIILCLQMKDRALHCRSLDLFPSLAHDVNVVQFERVKLPVKLGHDPFVGDPSPELDHAWHMLFEDVNTRVTPSDLAHAQVDSLKLADGSGDAVGLLGMHHELHCLKRIRRWIYRDYYYPNLTAGSDAFAENKVHVDHCIELLRVTIMCHADTSLSTFEWLNVGNGVGPSAHDKAYHSCAKLDPLLDWVRGRSLDLFQPELLAKAKYGGDE